MKSKSSSALTLAFLLASAGQGLFAVPPLVSGDVPTADKETFEFYPGFIYETDKLSTSRGIPGTELVYGISDRQEINLEVSYISLNGANGFGDTVIGTKYNFVKETQQLPGVSVSFELTLPTGRTSAGLGAGVFDYNFLARTQKTWGWFTALANVGYSILPDAHSEGGIEKRKNTLFLSFVQEYQLTSKTKLFAEVYLQTSEEPGQPNRFAGDIGLERVITDKFRFQTSIGKSLREGNQGGPGVLLYAGFEWDFDAPWKHPEGK